MGRKYYQRRDALKVYPNFTGFNNCEANIKTLNDSKIYLRQRASGAHAGGYIGFKTFPNIETPFHLKYAVSGCTIGPTSKVKEEKASLRGFIEPLYRVLLVCWVKKKK